MVSAVILQLKLSEDKEPATDTFPDFPPKIPKG